MSDKEPWYMKQMKDPTGTNKASEKTPMLTGCVSLIFIMVIVVYVIFSQ
jgi:hypothetical protein